MKKWRLQAKKAKNLRLQKVVRGIFETCLYVPANVVGPSRTFLLEEARPASLMRRVGYAR